MRRMAKSIHKNGIYSIARNATEFIHFGMNKRRFVTSFELQYELVYVNITIKKYGLNMNPALIIIILLDSVCMNGGNAV